MRCTMVALGLESHECEPPGLIGKIISLTFVVLSWVDLSASTDVLFLFQRTRKFQFGQIPFYIFHFSKSRKRTQTAKTLVLPFDRQILRPKHSVRTASHTPNPPECKIATCLRLRKFLVVCFAVSTVVPTSFRAARRRTKIMKMTLPGTHPDFGHEPMRCERVS